MEVCLLSHHETSTVFKCHIINVKVCMEDSMSYNV